LTDYVIVVSCNLIVATGFPAGQTPLTSRLEEINYAVSCGASEIDIVINRQFALSGNWKGIYLQVLLSSIDCPCRWYIEILLVIETSIIII